VNPQGYPQQGYPQQGYPQQGYPQQPPAKKGKGCLIAGLIVGGVLLVLGIVGAILVYKVVGVAKETLNAPGSKELQSAGCDIGMVMDIAQLGATFDAGASSGDSPRLIVSCSVNAGKTPPTCDAIAKTYVKAVPNPAGKFMAQVQVSGKSKPECQKVYAPDGTFIKDMPH
jgi:hypothetical protein